jgi:peptide/nickel transport system permease protein
MFRSALAGIPRPLVLPLCGIVIVAIVALLTPLLPLQDPLAVNVANRLVSPSWQHWLGTDEYGRDVLSRIVWGARVTLAVSLSSALIAGAIGVLLALIGGYFGGIAELLTVRLTDIVVSFPPILLALLVVTLLGPGVATLIFVLSLLYIPGYTRVAYGEVLSVRAMEYVEASRALGARWPRILFLTILPNILPPLLVQFSLTVAAAIVIESGLSFLGLGVVPPAPSWGTMIRAGRSVMEHNSILLLWPSLALVGTILLINQLCDRLRDQFDPRAAAAARAIGTRRIADLAGLVQPQALSAPVPADALLSVRGLRTCFDTPTGALFAVDDVSFDLHRGETLAVVGESGSGKSVTGLSILGLVERGGGRIANGEILLRANDGRLADLARLQEAELRPVRGQEVAMIFQEPMTSLNPVYRVGHQIAEALLAHKAVGRRESWRSAVAMLEQVGIPDPASRARAYPHRLSGGMRQRAMIAMALICNPGVLIADEPTTALDVTIQAEIIDLLRKLRRDSSDRMGIIFVTHNLGVVAEIADRVLVMYAGQVVEEADVRSIFRNPRHPYTIGLVNSIPKPDHAGTRAPLRAIPGTVPALHARPPGCAFAPRCSWRLESCTAEPPPLVQVADSHKSRCYRWMEL